MNKDFVIYQFQKLLMGGYSKLFLNTNIQYEAPLSHGPKIFVANHPTTTDPFFLSLLSNEPISILVTGMAFEVPIFGPVLRAAGHIPVDKTSNKGQAVILEAIKKLSLGKTIGIFPEGALSPFIGDFCQPKTGAARIALLSGAPVIPVGIHLEKNSYFEKVMTTKNYKSIARIIFHGKYAMTVGKPTEYFGDVEDFDYVRKVADQIMVSIIQKARISESRILQTQVQNHKTYPEFLQSALRIS